MPEHRGRPTWARTVASIVVLIAVAVVFAAGESKAAKPAGSGSDGGSLLEMASIRFPDLTRAERAILEFVDVKNVGRQGDWAVCGTSPKIDDATNDPKNAHDWEHERDVRALLIRWLCVDPETSHRVDPGGLRMLGTRVTGALDLRDARLSFPLIIRNCAIPERMNLTAANIPRLDLNGSYTGEIEAKDVNINTDLDLGRGFHSAGEVSLSGSSIGGDLNASGGHFMHSKVEPQPFGAQWKMALFAPSARITGNVWLCCGFESDGDVYLSRAKIGGEVYAFGGRFLNPNNTAFDGSRSEIDGDVWFANFAPLGAPEVNGLVDFQGAVIPSSGALVFNGARFRGAQGEIHGLFAFSGVFGGLVWVNNVLENGATLNLRDVTTQVFYDDEQSWPQPGDLHIDGFTYGDFGGGGRTFGEPPSDAQARLKWIALEPKFHSQPYRQLAKVLAARGDQTGAQQVLIALEDARYASGNLFQRIFGGFLKATIGYGHRPMLMVIWMLGVVAVGWVMVAIGKRSGVMRPTWPESIPAVAEVTHERLHPLLYSFDVFLPFVNFHQEHYWWPDAERTGGYSIFGRRLRFSGSLLRYYLWAQITAGWLLSAIFVAGVTGLIRSD